MSTGVHPIAAAVANPELWPVLAAQIDQATGLPPTATPEALAEFIGGAIALLYEADASGEVGPLRDTFADPVVAQIHSNPQSLGGRRPDAASIEWVGSRLAAGHPVIRAHVSVTVQSGRVDRQFWDLLLGGGQATVAHSGCPTCGAPLAPGELVCSHCGSDVRATARPDVLVARLELY